MGAIRANHPLAGFMTDQHEAFPIPLRLELNQQSLEVLLWKIPDAGDTIVLIHEALGSAAYWKNFPEGLGQSTATNVLAYSRAGHGDSEGPLEPRSERYYAYQVESVLPALVREFEIAEPILYGHSEGAAIAFLYAASGKPTKAIIAESPIVIGEKRALATVEAMNASDSRDELIEKLRRYHNDPEAVVRSWVEGVRGHLSREFPSERYLTRVACPVLAIQGAKDPFGGASQAKALQAGIAHLELVVLAEAGHLPHREQPEAVIAAAARFLNRLRTPQNRP
jgi:pimeloyl-ACP methyl ester carboxylesterase